MRTAQRTAEVMKKIAPGLHEDSRSEKSQKVKELVFKLNKREKKWLELLVCQHDTTRLNSDARDYLSSLLGKNGGNAGTSSSSYHGDDNGDDRDLNYDDDDGDDDGYDDGDTAVCLKRPAEPVHCRRILQMTIMAHTGIIPQLAHHTWIMCQTNCQKFYILLLFSKKILFPFKK